MVRVTGTAHRPAWVRVTGTAGTSRLHCTLKRQKIRVTGTAGTSRLHCTLKGQKIRVTGTAGTSRLHCTLKGQKKYHEAHNKSTVLSTNCSVTGLTASFVSCKAKNFCFRSAPGEVRACTLKTSRPKPVLLMVYFIMINQLQGLPTGESATAV
jgi:hypothetical protein